MVADGATQPYITTSSQRWMESALDPHPGAVWCYLDVDEIGLGAIEIIFSARSTLQRGDQAVPFAAIGTISNVIAIDSGWTV